jgi:hypothetical protein
MRLDIPRLRNETVILKVTVIFDDDDDVHFTLFLASHEKSYFGFHFNK